MEAVDAMASWYDDTDEERGSAVEAVHGSRDKRRVRKESFIGPTSLAWVATSISPNLSL
jgi:hypothetical protein